MKKFAFYLLSSLALIVILRQSRLLRLNFSSHTTKENGYAAEPSATTLHADTVQNELKRFIYLVQTEECLPRNLTGHDYLGNANDCDVIVFSFKKMCMDNYSHHIQYIHTAKSTWNTGRNLLYTTAKARNISYLYYIFLDDDIQFGFDDNYAPAGLKGSLSPSRAFEGFLLDHEPAIGVVNYQHHHNADFQLRVMKKLCPGKNLTKPLHLTIVHFDAIFNAFHRDSIGHILPYSTQYDHLCWWDSQRLVVAITEILFRGHTVMYTPVIAYNTKHRPYPVNQRNKNAVWSELVKTVIPKVPKEYQDQKWIQDFIRNPIGYTDAAPTLCWDLPPHHPIKPFHHFTIQPKTT